MQYDLIVILGTNNKYHKVFLSFCLKSNWLLSKSMRIVKKRSCVSFQAPVLDYILVILTLFTGL